MTKNTLVEGSPSELDIKNNPIVTFDAQLQDAGESREISYSGRHGLQAREDSAGQQVSQSKVGLNDLLEYVV